jgi:hypothetical protein
MDQKNEKSGKPSDIGAVCTDIDAHIQELLKDADPMEIGSTLMRDLIKLNRVDAFDRWNDVYNRQPSYKHLIRSGEPNEYEQKMKEKFITVYKICLGVIKEESD